MGRSIVGRVNPQGSPERAFAVETYSIKWQPEARFVRNGHIVNQYEGFVLRIRAGARSYTGWFPTRKGAQCALASARANRGRE